MGSVPGKNSRPPDNPRKHSNSSGQSRPNPAQRTPRAQNARARSGAPDSSAGSRPADNRSADAGGQVVEELSQQSRQGNRARTALAGAQTADEMTGPELPGGLFVNPAPSSEETERLAKDLLDRTRAETTQAENKAAILLAGVLAGAGGIAAAGGGKWTPDHRLWYITVPFWAAAAATLAAIACLAAAVYPRNRIQKGRKLAEIGYFGDVTALGSPSQLRDQLCESGTRLIDVWVDQIWQTSAIVSRKYRLVRWSIRLLGVALALAMVSVVAMTRSR